MDRRVAKCVCGQLQVSCEGEPLSVSLCHCLDCQRRTGSTYGVAAFFDRSAVRITGEATRFARPSDSGHEVSFHFCPACGTSLYWEPSRKPGMIAVALGGFADPSFPAPKKAVYSEHQHPWVKLPF